MVRRPRVPALLAAGALALGLLVTGLPAAHVARASTAEQLVTPDLVARAPVESLARGQTGTTGIPVTLKWPVFQAGAGGVRYAVEANVNAGGFTPVTLSWPGAQGVTVYLAPGARYQYRDQATDAAGTQTEWMGGPVFGVNVAQESSSDIAYSATWTQTTLAGAYGGSVRFATAAGAKATTTLLGTSVGVVSTLGPDRGLADIYLDGIRVAGVDLYAPTTVRHQVV